jgi:hypothetical protein
MRIISRAAWMAERHLRRKVVRTVRKSGRHRAARRRRAQQAN